MAFLARLFMFAIGGGLGGMVLLVLETKFDHAWLPLLLGAVYCVTVGTAGWRPTSGFLVTHCLALIAGVFGLWMYTVYGSRLLSGSGNSKLFLGLAAGASLLLALSLGMIFTLPSAQRKGAGLLTLVLLFTYAVTYASSSAGGTDPFFAFFERTLGLTDENADLAVKATRKAMHFLFYGLAALTASRAAMSLKATRWHGVLFGFAIALALASFDEYRQSMADSRTGSPWDILLDMAGAAVFLCIPPRKNGVRSR